MSDPVTVGDRGIKGLRRRSREVKSSLLSRRIADFEKKNSDTVATTVKTADSTSVTNAATNSKQTHSTSRGLSHTSTTATSNVAGIVTSSGLATLTEIATPKEEIPTAIPSVVDQEQDSRPASPFSVSSDNASADEDSDEAIIRQLQSDLLAAINSESRSRLAGVLAVADPALCLQALLSYSNPNRELKYRHDPDVQNDADELLGRSVANLNALHIACFLGEEEIACILLDYVARVTKSMDARKVLYEFLGRVWGDGNTALHLASFFGMDDLVQRLLKLGANMNKRNDRKYKAVDCADDDATRKLFLEMMQGTVIRIPMRKSVSMDDIFHGEPSRESHSATPITATKIPPSSDRPRVLYKLPTGTRSALLSIADERTDDSCTEQKATNSTFVSSNTKETSSFPEPAPLRHHISTSLDTASLGLASQMDQSSSPPLASDIPLSPSKKRTIGRLIEALSTPFRAISHGSSGYSTSAANDASIISANTPRHGSASKSLDVTRTRPSLDAASPSTGNNRLSVDSKIDTVITEQSITAPLNKGPCKDRHNTMTVDGSTATITSIIPSSSSPPPSSSPTTLIGSAVASTQLPTESTQRASKRKALRVRFDPAAVLLDAARYGDTTLMRGCIEAGISPDYQSAHRRMGAIHMAASYDHLDACRLLVEQGATVCLQDAEGWTPLHCAAAEGHLRVVTYLLSQGVDTSLVNVDGETPEDVAEEDRVRNVLHASVVNAAN